MDNTRPLVDALRPFAEAARHFTSAVHNGGYERVISSVNGEDFRRAAATLATLSPASHDSRPDLPGSPEAKIESYNTAHEDAVEMGYPSLTEALEHLGELRSTPAPDALREKAFNAGWDAGAEWSNGSGLTEEWEAKSAALRTEGGWSNGR